jgi:hypothetical protein
MGEAKCHYATKKADDRQQAHPFKRPLVASVLVAPFFG